MQITFGRCEGKTSQEVVLKKASYVKWVLGEKASGALLKLQVDMKKLIARLDNRPYVSKCSKAGCTRPVSRLTAYANNDADLYSWCAICDPYSLGANSGKLTVVTSYKDVLNHVMHRCGATNGGYDRLIKEYARSKGLPSRVGAAAAAAFFA